MEMKRLPRNETRPPYKALASITSANCPFSLAANSQFITASTIPPQVGTSKVRRQEITPVALRWASNGISNNSECVIWLILEMTVTSSPLSRPITMLTSTRPVSRLRTKFRRPAGSSKKPVTGAVLVGFGATTVMHGPLRLFCTTARRAISLRNPRGLTLRGNQLGPLSSTFSPMNYRAPDGCRVAGRGRLQGGNDYLLRQEVSAS